MLLVFHLGCVTVRAGRGCGVRLTGVTAPLVTQSMDWPGGPGGVGGAGGVGVGVGVGVGGGGPGPGPGPALHGTVFGFNVQPFPGNGVPGP